jgi:hypothetical protein
VLCILKKLKIWLIGVHFILETDANTLVAQLNGAVNDHPGAMLTRWLTWIRLFDFEVRHVKGSTHTAADALSRRPKHSDDTDFDDDVSDNDEDWILSELGAYEICPVELDEVEEGVETDPELARRNAILQDMRARVQQLREGGELTESSSNTSDTESSYDYEFPVSSSEYSDHFIQIALYLTTLKTPKGMDRKTFRAFKKEALSFGVHGRKIWKLPMKGAPIRLVIDTDRNKARILRSCHNDSGHKGRESTYHRISTRYFWKGCYKDTMEFVQTCPECQLRSLRQQEEPLFPTASNGLMEKWALDITYMTKRQGKQYLVVARDDMSGWVEARALSHKTAAAVASFIWEDIICRHGLFWRLVVDGGKENIGEVIQLLNKMEIQRVQVSAYNPRANGMAERGHGPIKNALSKMGNRWIENLPAVLFADRTTVHGPTGFTPFYMVYGREPILPVETQYPTWRSLFTEEVTDRSKLLQLRAIQFQMRQENINEAILRKSRRRQEGRDAFNDKHNIRQRPFQVKDMVLRYDSVREIDKSTRRALDFRWLGPYEIAEANTEKGYYKLKELGPDGPWLQSTFAGSMLKLFHPRTKFIYSDNDTESIAHASDQSREVSAESGLESSRHQHFSSSDSSSEAPNTPTIQVRRNDGVVVRIPEISQSQREQYRVVSPYFSSD